MWKYFGVLINVCTVLLGGILGLALRKRSGNKKVRDHAPPRENLADAMMVCLGFCTIFAAVSGLIGISSGKQALVVVLSMAGGFFLGWLFRLDDRLGRLGDAILSRTGSKSSLKNPAEGFVTACLLFCIGSMTVLGSFESAANPPGRLMLECHTTLLIKSMMDFISSTCLTVTYGLSVLASAGFVLVFQGALVALAAVIQPFLIRIGVMPVMSCTGSLILLAIAVNLLGIKKIKTADYLPALFLPILICWLLSLLGISLE